MHLRELVQQESMKFVWLVHTCGEVCVWNLSNYFTRVFVGHNNVERLGHMVIGKRQGHAAGLEREFWHFARLGWVRCRRCQCLECLRLRGLDASHCIFLMHGGVLGQWEGRWHTGLSTRWCHSTIGAKAHKMNDKMSIRTLMTQMSFCRRAVWRWAHSK